MLQSSTHSIKTLNLVVLQNENAIVAAFTANRQQVVRQSAEFVQEIKPLRMVLIVV